MFARSELIGVSRMRPLLAALGLAKRDLFTERPARPEIEVRGDHIQLDQALKTTGLCHSGGCAHAEIEAGKHLVYLMHRADRGFRIGRTKSVRSNSRGESDAGFKVRTGTSVF